MDKSGRDYFCNPVLSQISPDAFRASQMQVHPSRIDDEQSRTRFHVAKNNDRARNFHRSRIKIFAGREFFSGREFSSVENFSAVENFSSVENFSAVENFSSVENFSAVEKIFWSGGIFAPKCCHVVQTKT